MSLNNQQPVHGEPCSYPLVDQENQENQDIQPKTLRFNSGKMRWILLPVEWMEELVRIFTKGAIKYAAHNWRNSINSIDHDDIINDRLESAYRHIAKRRSGEIYDTERLEYGQIRPDGRPYNDYEVDDFNNIKTSHMGHGAWNLLFVYFYDLMAKK